MLLKILASVFGFFVHLYPADFQAEFGEELKSVFEAILKDASQNGGGSVAAVCLRELRDLPINLLRAHLEKKHMIKILHSQPVRFAWKGAFGFGLGFVVVNMLGIELQNWFFKFVVFQPPFINWFMQPKYQMWLKLASELIPWAVVSVLGGLLFAAFFAKKGHFRRFAFWGAIGWFVPGLEFWGLSELQMSFFLFSPEVYQSWIFNTIFYFLSGGLLGAILGLIAESKLKKVGLVIMGGILYPLIMKILGEIWAVLPSISSLLYNKLQTYSAWITMALAGISFGVIMGLILGWGRNEDKPLLPSSSKEN